MGGTCISWCNFFEHNRIDEGMSDSICVAKMGENGKAGMFCNGNVEECRAADLAILAWFELHI